MPSTGDSITLTVAEAKPRDAGRGIARMDPKDMATLGLKVGDIVLVTSKRASAARVMPAYPEDRDKGTIQVDGIMRENTGASLYTPVQLAATSMKTASSLTLAPITTSRAFITAQDAHHLARLLEGLPVIQGDKIRASTPFGSRYQEFLVLDTSPLQGVVSIGPNTNIVVKGKGDGGRKNGVTYEDIGGLRREIHQVREMIELPLKHPELFERLGIDAPRGVLLHGAPGCGKTLIARAVANETNAAFFHVSGPEIIHRFYGESEAHLRAIFEEASKKAPSIVFLDEIDAIAAKREEVRGDQQVEKRVVAQLLSLLDGLKSRGQVIVIGATNIPDTLDPALRRPGRFDREVVINVPDKYGRLEILQVHTRSMPLAQDVDLERLAAITHGFVGADLAALCREAAMATLRKLMPQLSQDDHQLPYELLSDLEVSMDDFLEAYRGIEPSAIREVFTEIPDVSWEEVGGLDGAKQALQEAVEWPLKHLELFQQSGVRPSRGILLYGLPGTGKTLLARAVASQSGVNFISVKGPALLSRWVGDSEKGVREVFKKARQASPCILFFDEIDSLTPHRSAGESGVSERVVGQFLTEMDGVEELKGVVVLAATNRPDIIDPALLRTGRFDIQIELPPPDQQTRRVILDIHTRRQPLDEDVDLDQVAAATGGLVGSDLEGICRRAAMWAIRERLQESLSGPNTLPLRVAQRHFQRALAEARQENYHASAALHPHNT